MPIVQHLLPIARPLAARVRSVRRPFRPSSGEGPYRLPHDVRDHLTAALAPFRNRDAAFALAAFLARYHSSPGRLIDAFVIDRRALVGHADLDLTEARIRRAIMVLEAVGFLDRALTSGSTHKATEDGLRRKPIRFVFGSEFGLLFAAANRRARKARGGDQRARRPQTLSAPPRPSAGSWMGSNAKSPKDMSPTDPLVNLGDIAKPDPIPIQNLTPLPRLSAAALKVFGSPRSG